MIKDGYRMAEKAKIAIKGIDKLSDLGKKWSKAGELSKYTDEFSTAGIVAKSVSGHMDEAATLTRYADELADVKVQKLDLDDSGVKGGSLSVQHAVGSANQAQSVLNGIDPQFFNKGSRFGGGFYVGADSNTIAAELAEHGNTAKYAISYDMNLSGQKVLDLTDATIASKWGYVQNLTSTEACQDIGTLARNQGYNIIKFQSYRGDGINYVIYNNFENILVPRMVTPID